jgi:hypothetical protein
MGRALTETCDPGRQTVVGCTKPVDRPFVDELNFGFGDSFILILSTQQFINRRLVRLMLWAS